MNYKNFNLGDWIGHISGVIEDERELDGNEMRDLVEFLSRLPRWIPVSERYPNIKDEYKYFLVTDDKGNMSVQEFFISLDVEPQPYFSGMRNVVAWMPLPKPYREVEE